MGKLGKIAILVVLGLVIIIILGGVVFERVYPYPKKVEYGVTFSPRYTTFLNLDWKATYKQVLDDLKVKKLRLPTYWDLIQLEPEKYNFEEVDFMLDEAAKRNAQAVLVVGMRQPRWPECFIPDWAKSLPKAEKEQKILNLIKETVQRYKDHPAIGAWQVENEPFLPFFGKGCEVANVPFLTKEVNLVRSLSNKTIIVSDSGELGTGIVPMQLSDIFGTTLYREVYNPVMGYFSYPVLPYFYNLKSQIVKSIFAPNNKKTIVIELQAEPWFAKGDPTQGLDSQVKRFPVKKLVSLVDYAKKTGFDEIYLWGVEWWYLMKEQGYPQYWEYAKTFF